MISGEGFVHEDATEVHAGIQARCVKKVVEQGLSVAEVARDLSICESLLRNWKAKFEAEGAVAGASRWIAGRRAAAAP